MTNLDASIVGLRTKGGRGFTLAVLEAFKYLGFEVEDVEETQGTQAHSDLIVKAHNATHPYFVVLECTAVREGSEVGYEKVGQLGSAFPRYVTRYGKDYPSSSKALVGRPSFSKEAVKLALEDTALLSAETLIALLEVHGEYFVSQDELEPIFKKKGEITIDDVNNLTKPFKQRGVVYALVYLALLADPTDESVKRKKEWTKVDGLVALVKHYAWFFYDAQIPDSFVMEAIRELSSPVLRVLLIEGENVMLSGVPFERVIQNMGCIGKTFKEFLMVSIEKAAKSKEKI